MVLMLLVVLCYTITSLNDKYAVTKAGMNGSQMTFIMAAATSFFMLFTLPFSDRTFHATPLSFLFIILLFISKLLEFQMSAKILVDMSAFELKAWLGICLFMSYFTDVFLGKASFSVVKILFIAITAAGLILIARSGRKTVNYKKIVVPLVLYLLSRYGYGIAVTWINKEGCISSDMALFMALILLAVVLAPKSGIIGLVKEKPKETAIVALAKIPNALGLMLENAVIAISLTNDSFIPPMILVTILIIDLFKKTTRPTGLNLAGSIVCAVGIFGFQLSALFVGA